jgi:hypothetical protein
MELRQFLAELDERRVPYRLDRVRDAVMVHLATPGSRWEVEFLDDGGVEVERFDSDGTLFGEAILPEILSDLQ